MRRTILRDLARQGANVFGAVFQVTAAAFGYAAGLDVAAVSDANRTLIVPADYAFLIWTPIFLLSFAYAVYQALPSRRDDALLRRIGWFTAGAFVANGIWEILFPNRLFLLAELTIVAIWALLAVAFVRLVAHARARPLTGTDRWLVALPVGLMFGWLTAANVVGLATTLVALGFASEGTNAAVGGAALLLFGGFVAGAATVAGKAAPPHAWASYAGSVIWALVAVAVNQAEASPLTAASALAVAAALVVVAVAVRVPPSVASTTPALSPL